jgi:hypothetical protein
LGPVQSRYILEGGGGDQLCGRAATGTELTDAKFANLPAHFNINDGEILTVEEWENILPGYSTFYPPSFRHVLLFLLASLVSNKEFMVENFDKDHPIFLMRVWTSGVLDKLKDRVLTGCGRNSISKMFATGIPPHILLANEIVKLRGEVSYLKVEILTCLEQLPEKIKQSMLNNFEINGTVPITHSQVVDMLSGLQDKIVSVIHHNSEQTNSRIAEIRTISSNNNNASNGSININNSNSQAFSWNNRWHIVPITFRFPLCNVKTLWDLWWNGVPVDRIAPYKNLRGYDLYVKSDKNRLTRAKRVLNKLITYSEKRVKEISLISNADRDRVFEVAYLKLYCVLRGNESMDSLDEKRIGETAYMTLYDNINSFDKAFKSACNVQQEQQIYDSDIESNNGEIMSVGE